MTVDLSSYKVTNGETSSATKHDNMVQAIEDALNAIPGFGAWTSYVPSWTAAGVAPNTGNGTLSGKYIRLGQLVVGQFRLAAGSSTTFGTGIWQFSLPVTAAAATTLARGGGYLIDSSLGNLYTAVVYNVSTTAVNVLFTGTGNNFNTTSALPFTWATGDEVNVFFEYEAA
jgi:hypothetical protein